MPISFNCQVSLLILAASMTMHAQEFPFKPLPTVRVHLTCAGDIQCADNYHVKPMDKWWEPLPVRQPTVDKKWLTATSISGILTAGDVENSIIAIGNCRNSHEVNPIYGSCPSRARYYAISGPLYIFNAYMSYKWKREDDATKAAGMTGHKYMKWWLPDAINGGGHLLGIIITLSATGK